MFEGGAFALPRREAVDVQVVRGGMSGEDKLELEFDLVALYRGITNRARGSIAPPTPEAVGTTGGELPGEDRFAGILAQGPAARLAPRVLHLIYDYVSHASAD